MRGATIEIIKSSWPVSQVFLTSLDRELLCQVFTDDLEIIGSKIEHVINDFVRSNLNKLNADQGSISTDTLGWINVLDEVVRIFARSEWSPSDQICQSSSIAQVPFSNLLVPFVKAGDLEIRRRLSGLSSDMLHQTFSDETIDKIYVVLVTRLSGLAERALFDHLNDIRKANSVSPYSELVRTVLSNPNEHLLGKYPVLARLLSQATFRWARNVAQFTLRLESDLPKIISRFNWSVGQDDLFPVRDLEMRLSDPHDFDQTVLEVTFRNGRKILYKPREVSADYKFGKLIDMLNSEGAPYSLKTPKTLACRGYGWAEFTKNNRCENRKQISMYFSRTGALACLMYVLRGVDCNYENIIADGGHPTLVDAETIMQPRLKDRNVISSNLSSIEISDHSVLSTCLFPGSAVMPLTSFTDNFAGLNEGGDVTFSLQWGNVNTNKMSLYPNLVENRPESNLPRDRSGERVTLEGHEEEVINGFRQTYDFILSNKEIFLDSPMFVNLWDEVTSRCLIVPTWFFQNNLGNSLNARSLVSNFAFFRTFSGVNEIHKQIFGEKNIDVLIHNLFALENMDVPRLTTRVTSRGLKSIIGSAENIFKKPGLSEVLIRIKNLSKSDRDRQARLIKNALASSD